MTIRVTSFDFDGCLFNLNYIYSEPKDVIAANRVFLDAIREASSDFTKRITFVGSNRQSLSIDIANSFGKGSCFPAVKTVSDYLGTTLDPFLLADIYGDLPDGTSYQRARDNQEGKYQGPHSEWLFDETKATILYAQMHKVAQENPEEDIIFDFYDDRGNRARAPIDILEHLQTFFTKYPELIPSNVTLRLNHYAGGTVTPLATIKGQGFIDANYKQTVKDMATITIAKAPYADGISASIETALHVDASELHNRKALTGALPVSTPFITIQLPPVMDEMPSPTAIRLPPSLFAGSTPHDASIKMDASKTRFYAQLAIIHTKALELRQNGHIKAANEADQLYLTLDKNAELYFDNRLTKAEFRDICTDAINTARPELETHRGWKQIIGNLCLAIAGLGIGYVVASLINKAVTGNFLFFRTDSAYKLDKMETTISLVVAAPAA